MKKLTAALAAFVALSSTVALAETPTVREMNTFETVLKKGTVKPVVANKGSEFVIYHQDATRPCAGKRAEMHHGKTRHEQKKAMKKAMHKKHHMQKDATKPVAKVKKDADTTSSDSK